MTTTPARWKAQSQANTTDGGTAQSDGQVAGTALGNDGIRVEGSCLIATMHSFRRRMI
jgi:hypothetical protein